MRYFMLAIAACLLAAAPAAAQSTNDDVAAPIKKFIDSFNKGDAAAAAATHLLDDGTWIVDEVPPYSWRGAKAFESWAADLAAASKAQGITDEMVTIKAPTRVEMHGDHAYVIVPAVYLFKQKGVAMSEPSQMTVVLQKGAGGWLIHGWTWTGPKPQKH
jgi:ketosteroid isomerase-like protein